MIVIADSSPIIALSIIDQLSLLETIFTKVLIPKAVFREIIVYDKPHAELLVSWAKSKVKEIQNSNKLSIFIDEGEAEAIVLAQEINADYLLIDDYKGRKVAEETGVKIIGVLGLLLKAKEKGLIKEIAPYINVLKTAGIYYSDQLVTHLLFLANEDFSV